MTHMLTRGEQQARKQAGHEESAAPFWFGMAGVIVVPTIVIIVGIIVAGA